MGKLLHYDAILSGKKKPNFHGAKGAILEKKIAETEQILESCELCERRCRVNRRTGNKGHCNVLEPRISTMFDHWGEEPQLVPSYTIFFSGCTFNCVFCQNWDISQNSEIGNKLTAKYVAEVIDEKNGTVRNVNWVGGDPTPNLAFILSVLNFANAALPQVWNSNMYLTERSMQLLDGVIDIYLTDFKYGSDACAKRLSNVENYWEVITRNHKLAAGQCDVIVRHLVMPNHVECCSKPILDWLSENIPQAKVNVMAQYRPEYRAREFEDLRSQLKRDEFLEAYRHAERLGIDLIHRNL